mmetsp:Transcript_352/g.693  ORF Transcript_352/g.693 Transcript_352/m.693 type:complete len:282 (-) Transcript_352:410-1255(-)
MGCGHSRTEGGYSDPDQPRRFKAMQDAKADRLVKLDELYEGKKLAGKVVLVTGSNRGLGLAITKELVAQGAKVVATCRTTAPEVEGLHKVVKGIDVTDNKCGDKLVQALGGESIDIVINNAGYFMTDPETIDNPNFAEELKMIDICAVGILRVTSAIVKNGLMASGSKVVLITSQGGSIAWRDVQNAGGPFDYGHHMSKAAANMLGKLLSIELKPKGIMVSILHPGFNRTDMTSKYEHIWEVEGAVDASVGAKRVCHEINLVTMDTTGKFINCEDGKEIPW